MSSLNFQSGRFDMRRLATLALVGLLLASAVGGVVGSSFIAAAQQGGPGGGGNNTTGGNGSVGVPENPGNGSAPPSGNNTITKKEFRQWFKKLEQMEMRSSKAKEYVKTHPRMTKIYAKVAIEVLGSSDSVPEMVDQIEKRPVYPAKQIRRKVGDGKIPVPDKAIQPPENPGNPGNPGKPPENPSGPTSDPAVNRVISEFKQQNLRYKPLSKKNKTKVQDILLKLSKKNVSQKKQDKLINRLERLFAAGTDGMPSKKLQRQRQDIIATHLKARKDPPDPLPDIKIDIPSLVDIKLKSLGDAFMESVSPALKTAYEGIWSTPVPENSGWHQLLGRPTNFPFQSIHANLLQKYIYPLMSKLLGIGLILTAGAILVNPLTSKYRAKDLFINFVTGVTLYAFSWLVMTTMHAVTDMAIRFIIPNPSKLTQSMENLLSLGAAPVALYLFGSGGLFSTLVSLGLEFWFRHVLLAYLLPYLFGALMLIAWVAPHGRLRKLASMGLWQYVNVLLWPLIPAAIFQGIIAVNWNFRVGKGGVIAVLVLISLFLVMIAIPIIQTWFFLQIPGAVHARVQSNVDAAQEKMESAASRVPNPLPSMSDIKDSATAAMATNEESPGDRAADMINAANISTTPTRSLSSSGTLDSSLPDDASTSSGWNRLRGDTTASKIRSLHQQNRDENMTAEAMKAEYFDRSLNNRMMTDGGTEADNHSRHITNI